MSYDVSVGDASFNYTSNLATFFGDFMPERSEGDGEGGRADRFDGLWALDGLTGKEAVVRLGEFFENVDRGAAQMNTPTNFSSAAAYAEMERQYGNEFGWGCVGSALVLMGKLMAACAQNKKARVRVSA